MRSCPSFVALATTLAVLSSAAPAAAQAPPTFSQVVTTGQPTSGSGFSVECTAVDSVSGDMYAAGYFRGQVLWGSTILTSTPNNPPAVNGHPYDLFAVCLDAGGAVRWAVQAGGTGEDVASGLCLDYRGHVFVAGQAQGTAAFGGLNLGNNPLASPRAVVARLDAATGAWQWLAQAEGGGNAAASATGVAADAWGHVYAVGKVGGTPTLPAYFGPMAVPMPGMGGAFVARLNATTGAWEWARAGGTREGARALALDGRGGVYAAGQYGTGNAQFGALPALPPGPRLFVARLDTAGAWLWATAGGGSEPNFGKAEPALAADGAGHLALAGHYRSPTASFGPTVLTNQSGRDQFGVLRSDGYVAGLDAATGAWRWAWALSGPGDDYAWDVAANAHGLYLTGGFGGAVQFGPLTRTTAPYDLYLARLDAATGAWRWLLTGGGRGEKFATSVALGPRQALCLTGVYMGVVADFGPQVLAGSPAESWGFVARLPAAAAPLTRQAPRSAPAALAVWPNPTRGPVQVGGPPPGAALLVLDALGRKVTSAAMPARGPAVLALPATPGIYFVRAGVQVSIVAVE